jgi:hypothetical protein
MLNFVFSVVLWGKSLDPATGNRLKLRLAIAGLAWKIQPLGAMDIMDKTL